MSCVGIAGGVVVCGVVTDDELRRRIRWCPFEQRNQEMVVRYEIMFGPTVWCCGCGDSWNEDGLQRRPLKRNWRREAVRHARRLWDRATYGEDAVTREFREMDERDAAQEEALSVACLPCVESDEMWTCARVTSGDVDTHCLGPRPHVVSAQTTGGVL